MAILTIAGFVRLRAKRIPPPPPAAAVAKIPDAAEVTLTGRLEARNIEDVDAPMAGILDAWFVDVGQEVYEDQLVGKVRNADLDNAAQKAQADLDKAELRVAQLDGQAAAARLEVSRTTAEQIRARNELDRIEKVFERYQKLMDVDAIARLTYEKTRDEFNAAKADAVKRDEAAKDAQQKGIAQERDSADAKKALDAATAALQRAKDALTGEEMHSPSDGVVTARAVHQGDKVEESTKALMTIATDLTRLQVVLTPEPAVLARIHKGQHAVVRITEAEMPGEVHEVRGPDVIVQFVSPEAVTKLGGAAQVRLVF